MKGARLLPASRSSLVVIALAVLAWTLAGCGTEKVDPAKHQAQMKAEWESGKLLLQKLLAAIKAKDGTTALPMAQDILQHDPTVSGPYETGQALRGVALGALSQFRKLDSYREDLEHRIAAEPNSLRLNLLAAEAYQISHGTGGRAAKLTTYPPATYSLPDWFKLSRQGDQFIASGSTNGQIWHEIVRCELKMDATALVGLIASPTTEGAGRVVWKEVRFNGERVAAGAAPALPTPWQYHAIGELLPNGGAEWDEAGLSMAVPTVEHPLPFYFDSHGCVSRPCVGDGEIVAQLGSMPSYTVDKLADNWAGLCFRARLDDSGPWVLFHFDSHHRAVLSTHDDAQDLGIRYYKRAAALAIDRPDVLSEIATQLRYESGPVDENATRLAGLKAHFPTDSIKIMDAQSTFGDAGELPAYVKLIEDSNAGGKDRFRMLISMGDDLWHENHPAEAERLYRKALQEGDSPQDASVALALLLLEGNRREEAAAEFEKGFIGRGGSWSSFFHLASMRNSMIEDWYRKDIYSFHRFSQVDDGTVPLLKLACAVGLEVKLKTQLLARGSRTMVPVDPSRVASILLSIVARDPAYRAELDSLLVEFSGPMPPMTDPPSMDSSRLWLAQERSGVDFDALQRIVVELARWPEERREALRVAQANVSGLTGGYPDDSGFRARAEEPILRAALEAGDHSLAREVLVDLTTAAEKYRAQPYVNDWPMDRAPIIRAMIQEGMLTEAEKILAEAQIDPRVVRDPAYAGKMRDIHAELVLAQTPGAPAPVVPGPALSGVGENLLANPGFAVTKDAQGRDGIAGWHGLLPANVSQGSGGPSPSGQYQIVEVPEYGASQRTLEIGCDAIPLHPGSEYLFSGWQHEGVEPRFLFLDAKGAEVGGGLWSGSSARRDDWQWYGWRLVHEASGNRYDVFIPRQAVSVRILFSHTWKVAGVSFRVLQ